MKVLWRKKEIKIKIEGETVSRAETSAHIYNDAAVGEEWNKIWRSRLQAQCLHLSLWVSGVIQR